MLNCGSDMLYEIFEIVDMKDIRFAYIYMNKKVQFSTNKFVAPKKNEFLRKDHMSQHPV